MIQELEQCPNEPVPPPQHQAPIAMETPPHLQLPDVNHQSQVDFHKGEGQGGEVPMVVANNTLCGSMELSNARFVDGTVYLFSPYDPSNTLGANVLSYAQTQGEQHLGNTSKAPSNHSQPQATPAPTPPTKQPQLPTAISTTPAAQTYSNAPTGLATNSFFSSP